MMDRQIERPIPESIYCRGRIRGPEAAAKRWGRQRCPSETLVMQCSGLLCAGTALMASGLKTTTKTTRHNAPKAKRDEAKNVSHIGPYVFSISR
jgi:hypothetical protein